MALPQFTLSEMLEAGVHFGHRTFRWNPKLRHNIYGSRNGVHIIDLTKTVPLMVKALSVTEQTVARGGRVLFVGTKKQAQQAVRENAERCGMFFVAHRWLGGTLTNWKTISQSIKRLKDMEHKMAESQAARAKLAELQAAATAENPVPANAVQDPLSYLTKKERLMLQREYDTLELVLGGIKNMNGLPDLVIVMDVKKDRIAVDEANRLGIPVIGIVDTNASEEGITYVVPGNDDASRAISLYTRLFSDAALSGIAQQAQSIQAGSEGRATRSIKPQSGTSKGADAASVTLSPKAKEAAAKAEDEAKAKSEAKKAEAKTAAAAEVAEAPKAEAAAS